jgi:hypothetical protein
MVCNYININDLCCEKYTYQYAATISNGVRAVAIDSDNAPVYRIDKQTSESILLTNISNVNIEPCSSNEEIDIISAWECYQIWKNDCDNTPSAPPIDVYRTTQKEIIEKSYRARLDEGYNTITSDGIRVTLGLVPEAQANLATAVLSANILYSNNAQSEMPVIYDINGQPLSFSYEQLILLYQKYTEANTAILSLKSYLISSIDAAVSAEEIVSYIWDLKLIEVAVACQQCYIADSYGECVPYIGKPEAPQSLVASPLDSSAYLSWQSPICDGGYETTGYTVQYSSDSGQTWTNFPTTLSASLFGIITGLSNTSSYVFRIAAINSAGTGDYSFASNAVIIAGDALFNKTRLLLSFD